MKNGVVLITYADSFGGDLKSLRANLDHYFSGCVSGIHILPFFPSSGDRGFSPVSYAEPDPAFGTWSDIADLGRSYEIMADFMVNHLSRQSMYFKDWLLHEQDSACADLFLPLEKVFGGEAPKKEEISKIYRRQPTEPWVKIRFPSGAERKIWCTFSKDQIDIDIASGPGIRLFREALRRFAESGIKTVRLDAVGYIVKKRGTTCFMVEPEIWELLDKLNRIAGEYDIELLPEMHEHYSFQLKMASRNYRVYDFALPLLLLYSFHAQDFKPLKNWFSICPRRQFTTLDTHDGIGVVDAADLLTPEQTEFTIDKLYKTGSNVKRRYSSAEYNNVDIYQINCTYYSALGEDDDAYIMARAIQFFAPGIPQVYYVGLLAGRNDLSLVEATKNGRDINRHNYTAEEIAAESGRPVVKRLKRLMEFRMNCRAFEGSFSLGRDTPGSRLELSWEGKAETAVLTADLQEGRVKITLSRGDGSVLEFKP